jgi:DNA replication and repair protein RecF
MLLDDVMSELDADRRGLLVARLDDGGQAVVTTTDLAHVPGAEASSVVRLAVSTGVATPDDGRGGAAAAPGGGPSAVALPTAPTAEAA